MRKLIFTFLILLPGCALWGQHSYTATDIEDGARQYQQSCSGCHGPEGDLVEGVNFSKGQFLSVKTDEDLQRVILKGIPGTPMPAATFASFMAFPVMAYVRSMSAPGQRTLPVGDAAQGKALFEGKGQCMTCHRVGMEGSRLGPNLSDIGGLRREVQLEHALLDPAKDPSPEYRTVRVVTKDGKEVKGRLLNLDTFTIEMLDSNANLRTFLKSDLSDYKVITNSGMPSYKDKMSKQELGDVVSYLITLKGAEAKGTGSK
jgi:cytochrome c oxidase cbb3-type subunit III